MNGTNREYIVERLKRGNHTELLAAVKSGTISALTAAVSLGWVKRVKAREKRREIALREINGKASLDQLQELWLGPDPRYGSLFATREELAAAWKQNKDEVMRLFAHDGRRPRIWWEFEACALGLTWPGYFREQSYLYAAGVLAKAEEAELEAEWKEEFDHAAEPNFMFHGGSAGILKGDQARAEHYRWADIPTELILRWTNARQRAAKNRDSNLGSQARSEDRTSGGK